MNVLAAQAFAEATQQPLHWYFARDTYDGKPIVDEELIKAIGRRHSGQTAHRLNKIPLVVGMPVMIFQNFALSDGVVNGCIGTLSSIRYSEDLASGKRYLKSCTVLLDDTSGPAMTNLSPGEYPVLPDVV
ncbi:hypothetical protein FKP32DRAFT_1564569, partial [Trametes sanguinea]